MTIYSLINRYNLDENKLMWLLRTNSIEIADKSAELTAPTEHRILCIIRDNSTWLGINSSVELPDYSSQTVYPPNGKSGGAGKILLIILLILVIGGLAFGAAFYIGRYTDFFGATETTTVRTNVSTTAPTDTQRPTKKTTAENIDDNIDEDNDNTTAATTQEPQVTTKHRTTQPQTEVTDKTTASSGNKAAKSLEFEWEYDGLVWTYTTEIKEEEYQLFRSVNRDLIGSNYSYYVTQEADDEWMNDLTQLFVNEGAKNGYSDFQIIEMMTVFVQSLEYVSDIIGTGYDEYPKFPMETLYDQGGDCEDSSILLASLIREMGYGVALIEFDDHMGVGVLGTDSMSGSYYKTASGDMYFYIETTDLGWEIGELPDDLSEKKAMVLPV